MAHKPRLTKNYRKSTRLQGWRFAGFAGAIIGFTGLAFYGIGLSPMLNPEPYKKIQEVTRAGIDQEKIQPGNMKVWTDPFDRPEKRKGKDEIKAIAVY